MNILLLSPNPFFQERGTPIAVNLMLRVLSQRGDTVDVLAYHEGADVAWPGVRIHRIPRIPLTGGVRPGLSFKKLACDAVMMLKAVRMASRNRYDLVHAVEESVFMAMVIRALFGIPCVFDMDSSMPQQIVEKLPVFSFMGGIMRWFEALAIRHALAVVAVCDSLADIARARKARKVVVLRDVSLLEPAPAGDAPDLREELKISGVCLLYVGNLEGYQGIDLMLESFALLLEQMPSAALVIAGGTDDDVRKYRDKARVLRIQESVRFIGHRPVSAMPALFAAADILVSPRIKGTNTPMKIYSYLHSGKPVLATDIASHTQVLDGKIAVLEAPRKHEFAAGMLRLAKDPRLRGQIADAARAMAVEKYCFDVFRKTMLDLYDWLQGEVSRVQRTPGGALRTD